MQSFMNVAENSNRHFSRREEREQARNVTDETAKTEASRCLFCFDAPCQRDCPAGIDVPRFIRRIMQGDLEGAYRVIKQENPLPWICGILCPTERLCASRCPRQRIDRTIRIGDLQVYASNRDQDGEIISHRSEEFLKSRVAIVGAGPAGLTAACYLSQSGLRVSVFEAEEHVGGLITYGVPPHRIDKKQALLELGKIVQGEGISIHPESRIRDPFQLSKEYGAVFLATGIGPEQLDGKASKFKNVYRATDFLKELNRAHLKNRTLRRDFGPETLVIGGGDTALDAAVAVRRLAGSNVTVLYRRTEKEMPAGSDELAAARKEGVHFRFLLEPKSFKGNSGEVSRVIFQQTRLGRLGRDGRRKVVVGDGPDVMMAASAVIMGTGRKRDESANWLKGRKVNPASGRVGNTNVFIGGEMKSGGGLAVQAVADGKAVARVIEEFLKGRAS